MNVSVREARRKAYSIQAYVSNGDADAVVFYVREDAARRLGTERAGRALRHLLKFLQQQSAEEVHKIVNGDGYGVASLFL